MGVAGLGELYIARILLADAFLDETGLFLPLQVFFAQLLGNQEAVLLQ